MSIATSILRLDFKGIRRDQVLTMNASMSFVIMTIITIMGLLRGNDPAWSRWFPGLLALAILGGPPSWGFLFGLLMVDEKETNVRAALSVTPVSPKRLLTIRAISSTIFMIVWPFLSVTIMNAAWRQLSVPWWSWLSLVVVLSLGAPLTALAVAAFAGNKVEALALYKVINLMALMPIALLVIPESAWWRWLFLLSPSTWGLQAFEALRAGHSAAGWLIGTLAFHSLLLGISLRGYARSVYKSS